MHSSTELYSKKLNINFMLNYGSIILTFVFYEFPLLFCGHAVTNRASEINQKSYFAESVLQLL